MDSNDIRSDIPLVKSGDRIGADYFNKIATGINQRRGGVTPPIQKFKTQALAKGTFYATVATTSTSTTHSGLSAIDGVSLSDGDIVLDWNNTTVANRGLFVAHSGAWTAGYDNTLLGSVKSVLKGSANADSLWVTDSATPTITKVSITITQNSFIANGIYFDDIGTPTGTSSLNKAPGTVIANGDHILVVNNTTYQNGLYVYSPFGAWTPISVPIGAMISVQTYSLYPNYTLGALWIKEADYTYRPAYQSFVGCTALDYYGVTPSGHITTDGVTCGTGDIICQNGSIGACAVYICTNSAWIQLFQPIGITVALGTNYGGSVWTRNLVLTR